MLEGFLLIVPMMVCIALGHGLFRAGVITAGGVGDMNSLIYYVAMPSLLFRSMLTVQAEHFADWHFLVVIHGAYGASLLAAWVIGRARRLPRPELAVSLMASMRSNNVFMAMPAVVLAYGSQGFETYCKFMALSLLGFELFSVLGGLLVLYGGLSLAALKRVLAKMVRNPMLIACTLGLCWGLFSPVALPRWLDSAMEITGNTGTGIALLVLGAKMRPELLLSALKRCWSDLLIRLVLSPLFVLLGCLWLPSDVLLTQVAVLVMAMPVAVNTLPLAEGMAMDGAYAAEVIVGTTLCSVVTIPLWAPVLALL